MKGNKRHREQWIADLRQRQRNVLLEDRIRNTSSLSEDDYVRPIKTSRQLIGLIVSLLAIVAVVALFVGTLPAWSLVLIVAAMLAALFFLGLTLAHTNRPRHKNAHTVAHPTKHG
jgi:VIT1/CCC1 family predicted Fe2+/Mn2+ transporter